MQAQSIWNTAHLANVKHSIHEPFYATTYEILKAEADRLLDAQPLSVMMKRQRLTSMDLANKAMCGLSTVQSARNERSISTNSARRLAAALGVPLDELVESEE